MGANSGRLGKAAGVSVPDHAADRTDLRGACLLCGDARISWAEGTPRSTGCLGHQHDLGSGVLVGSTESGTFQVAVRRAWPPGRPMGEMFGQGRHGSGSSDVF